MLLGAIGGFNPLAMLGGMAATKAVDAVSSIFAQPDPSQPAAGSSELQQLPLDDETRQQFLDFAKMDETEKLQLAWLEKNDLTAEKLAGMDAQQRAGLEEDLRKKVEEHVRTLTGKTAGGLANLVV
ncbi:MAG: hypothetical protein OJJ21_03630 [Ferrovibrio sp.]|uniref:hypothetical protein n=1 Tax=Ferrovibrio sp. TaxID=1917215 RepID=UPI00262C226F|nr:hypothetical protein [Ferrovibrio sp.]MCW0232669.1 hypothetical protein [Ferrovibrio sp.]